MERRHFLQTMGLTIAPMIPGIAKGKSNQNPKRPNILFIMDDQHRGDCIGADGADWLETPNLDALAKEGMLFRKAYTSMPSCLPARAALLTGKSPYNHGLLVYAPIAKRYVNEKPRLFTEAGYRTHAVGKNHYSPMRNTHGYQSVKLEEGWHSVQEGKPKCDYQLWFEKTAPNKDMNASGLHYTDHRGGRVFPFKEELHPTHWTAEQAIDFLQTYKKGAPWFLKVSFQRPHPPFDPPQRWADHYKSKKIPMPRVGKWAHQKYGSETGSLEKNSNATHGVFPEKEIRSSRKFYYAGLSYVDEQIGRVLNALENRGEMEDTLILFTSDHGDMMGDHHLWRKCRAYDPSARIPMIVRWPESMNINAKRGQFCDKLVELRDVLPTFLDAANLEKPNDMDGQSLLDLIRGKSDWRKRLDLEHGQIYEKDNAWIALTDGRYKYIYFTLTGEQQLFDLKKDPDEMIDLTQDKVHSNLLKKWRQYMYDHLAIRGEPWIRGNDLAVQNKQIKYSPNEPRYNPMGNG